LSDTGLLSLVLRIRGLVLGHRKSKAIDQLRVLAFPQPTLVGGRFELGRAEVVRAGNDGTILCCGTQLADCVKAADELVTDGLNIRVINARFVKPLDREIILDALRTSPFVITVEEGALMGGFGSAVLELAADQQIDASHVRRLGVPDSFIEHGERAELLADLKLDAQGIAATCREMSDRVECLTR
jgi:1-deoxy-D-xylulose-5-phosphate synthase